MSGLWLCLWPQRLALDALADPRPQTVVYAQSGARRWVLASGDARVAPGEALGSVQARFPELRPRPRDVAAERATLQTLACLAWQFGDRVTISDEAPRSAFDLPFGAVSVDIGPSLRLFGGLQALLDAVQHRLADAPCSVTHGVAPTPEAAAIAARLGLPPIGSARTLARVLSGLPLDALRWPPAVLDLLHGSGHRSLGDLQRHDAASLALRLGPDIPLALDRLYGRRPDPRALFSPPTRFRRQLDLGDELTDTESLQFPARRLLLDFQHYLEARHAGVTEFTLSCHRHRALAQNLTLRTTAPTRDATVFLRLLREHWNHQPPSGGVSELRLVADHFVAEAGRQSDLFDAPGDDPAAWNGVIDRLRARLGATAVWQPGIGDDHRPERAWNATGDTLPGAAWPPRPLWLLRRPQRHVGTLTLKTPAERIETGWWDDHPVARDYHWALGARGERLWVFRDLHAGADAPWQVHGYGSPAETRRRKPGD